MGPPRCYLIRLAAGSTFRLLHVNMYVSTAHPPLTKFHPTLIGRVCLVSFWTSWAIPCWKPMALVNGLMKAREKEWHGKVVVVAVSLDDAAGRIKALEHAEKKGWSSIVHVWSGEGEFDAPVAKSFAIDAIPVSILFDQHGHVAWRGHPGEVDLAELVTNLLRAPPSPTHAFKGQSPAKNGSTGASSTS